MSKDDLLRKALWTIQKLADELNLDYDQMNELYYNVMDDITSELESRSKEWYIWK